LVAVAGLAVSGHLAAQQGPKAATASQATVSKSLSAAEAESVFNRFKALAGDWEERSTAGWEGTENYTLIARGTVLMATSHFKDQAHEGMATMIHRDGDRLLLTHYCEAGNQPRLVASELADEGRTVVFTFLDGTNLPARDVGHMDKVVLHFLDDDHFTSRWTWYSKGKETWFEEEVSHTRLREKSQR